jgi:thiamine pyrophosphokinase
MDQIFANINILYKDYNNIFERIILISSSNISFVLFPGEHLIFKNKNMVKNYVGLIPLGTCCKNITTKGKLLFHLRIKI